MIARSGSGGGGSYLLVPLRTAHHQRAAGGRAPAGARRHPQWCVVRGRGGVVWLMSQSDPRSCGTQTKQERQQFTTAPPGAGGSFAYYLAAPDFTAR